MKQKLIVISILSIIAIPSSYFVLKADGYFDNRREEKVLAQTASAVPISLAKESAPVKPVVKKPVTVKKAPVKKPAPKKKVVKKKKGVNLAPPVITPATAPYSAKNKYN